MRSASDWRRPGDRYLYGSHIPSPAGADAGLCPRRQPVDGWYEHHNYKIPTSDQSRGSRSIWCFCSEARGKGACPGCCAACWRVATATSCADSKMPPSVRIPAPGRRATATAMTVVAVTTIRTVQLARTVRIAASGSTAAASVRSQPPRGAARIATISLQIARRTIALVPLLARRPPAGPTHRSCRRANGVINSPTKIVTCTIRWGRTIRSGCATTTTAPGNARPPNRLENA